MINQSSDEYLNSKTNFSSFIVNDVNNQQFKTQTYLQPIKIFHQQQQSQQQQQQQHSQPIVPQTQSSQQQFQLHQFKSVSINDEIISPLSNSSSTSSSSSMSSSSSTSSCTNNSTTNFSSESIAASFNINNKDRNKLKIKSLNENYVTTSGKSSQKKISTNKKKSSQMTNDLDEERTSQLVSELLRNIKEKTKQLESLNQHMKSNHSCNNFNNTNSNINNICNDLKAKSNDLIVNSPVNNTSILSEATTAINVSTTKPLNSSNKRSRTKTKKQTSSNINSTNQLKEIRIPNGWQRQAENSTIVYKSPTGVRFYSFQDIRTYLLATDTCKCGLECPLNIYETFNFDINVKNMPLSSLTDLSNKLTSCCLHKSTDFDLKKTSETDLSTNVNQAKKRRINDENHKLIIEASSTSLDYHFSDDLIDATKLDSSEFSLIQLNNDTDLTTNANLMLESNYLNLNDDLDLMQTTASTVVKSNDNESNNLQQLINHDLLMSSSLTSSLTNTPVILTPHSSTSIDYTSTSISNTNSKNIFNFYSPADEKNFDKAILRMIGTDCNEIINDDSLELNGTSHHFNSNVNSNQTLLTSNFIPQDLSDLCRLVND